MVQDEGLANTKTSQQCAVVLQVANLSCQDEIGQLCPMTGPFGHLPMSEAVDGTSRWFGKATFRLLGLPLWEKLLWVTALYCHSNFTIFATWVCLKVVRAPDFSGKVPYITVHHTAYTVYFSTQRYFLTDQSRSLVIIRLYSPHHSIVRCWAHEAHRVFYDRLVTKEDQYLGTSLVWLDVTGNGQDLWLFGAFDGRWPRLKGISSYNLELLRRNPLDLGKGWFVVLNHCADKFS